MENPLYFIFSMENILPYIIGASEWGVVIFIMLIYAIPVFLFFAILRKVSDNEDRLLELVKNQSNVKKEILALKRKVVEEELDKYRDKVLIEAVRNIINLRIYEKGEKNLVSRQKKAQYLLNKTMSKYGTSKAFIHVRPSQCLEKIILPIVEAVTTNTKRTP